MLRTSIAIILLFFACVQAEAAIIFSENFDSHSGDECTVNNSTAPDGWDQWMTDGISASHDSVTHYSGEITETGRGGSGKSLKLWRHSDSWVGSASYAGSLLYTAPTGYANFFLRFYAKIPTGLYVPYNTKMWRFNVSGGSGEIYVNLNAAPDTGGKGYTYLWVWGGSGDSSDNTTLVNAETLETLWDGDWHCWQFQFNLTAGTVTFWGDGVQLGSITDSRLQAGTWNSYMQHWPLGNAQGSNWQSSWLAFEVDDLIIATTKAETDPDDAEPTPARKLNNVTGVRVTLH